MYLGYSGIVTQNNQISSIDTWGPQYTVVVDIIVHSAVEGPDGWSNIIHFTTGDECCNIGERIPAIYYNSGGYLRISSAVSGNGNFEVDYSIDLNKWYHIEIAQTWRNGKVREFNHNQFLTVNLFNRSTTPSISMVKRLLMWRTLALLTYPLKMSRCLQETISGLLLMQITRT